MGQPPDQLGLDAFGLQEVGDFLVPEAAIDTAQDAHQGRSERAIQQDNRRRAAITTDPGRYAAAPGEFDFPGVDTPREEPNALPKDYMRGGQPRTTDVDESELGVQPDRNQLTAHPEWAENSSLQEAEKARFSARAEAADVSLSYDEAYEGVGATGRFEGGRGDVPVTDDTGRFDMTPQEEQRELDRIAAEQSRDTDPFVEESIQDFNQGDVGLRELSERLESRF